MHQDRASARLVYEALANRSLRWIGLADRSAGNVDDLVLGLSDTIVGHQFKRSAQPGAIGLAALLLGKGRVIGGLAASYFALRRQFPGLSVRLRYITNDYPSVNDRLIKGDRDSTTAAFLAESALHPRRSLADWRASRWARLIDELLVASNLAEPDFESFWVELDLVVGAAAAPALDPEEDGDRRSQIEELARTLSTLVADNPSKDRWSRVELLEAIGWPDRFALRFTHAFPVGAYVQRNEVTESRLAQAIGEHDQGYLSLVGPPGAGKSTLLQRGLREQPGLRIVRYLAFVPGTAQGQGRGEADSFYEDLSTQLASTGLRPLRLKDDTTRARQQEFEHLLARAGECHIKDGTRYVIVVDGLDHIPREEHPDRSLLAALPLPQSVPEGVVFVLGTQRLDLDEMPPMVRDEAAASGRRVEITPLTERAVAAMVDALGLPSEVSREAVHRVANGHPLVTRYLVERLNNVDSVKREQLLAGKHGFSGDLEAVYEAAWRGVEQAERSTTVKQMLALIAYSEGPIEPALLARATSDEAVEVVLREAGHLLDVSALGWSVFHNSFRLFVQRKPILRFGTPDPRFEPSALYRTLAELTRAASPKSSQRWLTFRYLYLAGSLDEALSLADRDYFVRQYCEGRPAQAVRGDVSDAFRILKPRNDAVKLFDLMLADDEVGRRATIMEGATSLIDAYLAVGDLEAAHGALVDSYEEGKQWLVVDALVKAGEIERARHIFEQQDPFGQLSKEVLGGKVSAEAVLAWAERAIRFLDEAQLGRYISESSLDMSDTAVDHEDARRAIKFQIARALARADGRLDLEQIGERWSVEANQFPILLLESAETSFEQGVHDRTRWLLEQASVHRTLHEIDPSWSLAAAHLAVRIGAHDMGKHFIANVPLQGLGDIEEKYRSEDIVPFCRELLRGIIVRVAIGMTLPALSAPRDRLLRGVQHHLVEFGVAIGRLRAGKPLGEAAIERLAVAAIHFLATAHVGRDEDWYTNYAIPRAAEVIGETLFGLLDFARVSTANPTRLVDELIAKNSARFRWWHRFRRLVALRTFDIDGDAAAALVRLESGLVDVNASDPREELEEMTAYAAAIATIGEVNRASAILAGLRAMALGAYLPAKKDGQYELWVDTLVQANVANAAGRAKRVATALRLVDGLEQTEGSGSAWRIGRQLLFEAATIDPTMAWSAARWAAEHATYSWDGIVDATLRGILMRVPTLASAVLIAWSHLCAPWYGEPHGSTTDEGQFLKDLMVGAEDSDVKSLEVDAADAIGELAQPDVKVMLLSVLEEAAKRCGAGDYVGAAAARWDETSELTNSVEPDRRSYRHLNSLAGVAAAIASEHAFRGDAERGSDGHADSIKISYGLRRAAARVIAVSTWSEARTFVEAQPTLGTEREVAMALARVAMAAGAASAARVIVAPLIDPDPEGWSWPSDRGRMRHHEIRHLLGESDAFKVARTEFVSDMASSRYGVSTALWSIGDIFPLLFEAIPWPELWERLEAQIQSTRDYRIGKPMSVLAGVENDSELIAELFVWALTLGVPRLYAEAARGAEKLLRKGHKATFVLIVERLIDSGGEAAMHGMDLLTNAVDDRTLSTHFGDRLSALANHPDVGVAAGATFIAERWGIKIVLELRELPPFYRLQLPPQDEIRGTAASDGQTRSMVIEDPMGWTEGWLSEVQQIADDAGLPEVQIRWRVRQLIQSWGGVDAFGHSGSKRLEAELSRMGLKLTYRRPQAEATLRALRYVVGELWRARRLSAQDWHKLLLKLHVYPDKAVLPMPEARPVGLRLPIVPPMMWGDKREAWLDAVSEDLETDFQGTAEKVIAEWCISTVRESRATNIAEQWRARAYLNTEGANLEALITELPRVIRIAELIPLYSVDEIHPSKTAAFEPRALQGEPSELLIFCPRTAAKLGWSSDRRAVHLYHDAAGREMARTVWWRSGLPQPIDGDGRFAEGQRVVLSETAVHAFEAMFGPIELTSSAWRRVETEKGDGTPGSRFATNAEARSIATSSMP